MKCFGELIDLTVDVQVLRHAPSPAGEEGAPVDEAEAVAERVAEVEGALAPGAGGDLAGRVAVHVVLREGGAGGPAGGVRVSPLDHVVVLGAEHRQAVEVVLLHELLDVRHVPRREVLRQLDHHAVREVRAVVGGVSGGSGVAVRSALRPPGRALGLVLVPSVYAGAERGYTEAQREAFARMDGLASRALDEGVQVLRPLYAELPEPIRERALAMLEGFDPASVVATSRTNRLRVRGAFVVTSPERRTR